ncbi:MAG TPA: DNA polymerase IV [Longimicrobium sp.]|uniref:DNA polymerase Y family protein n=1 Tax=Longimicrobium sp. TaxID=2029185 RepID=UPI002ED9C89A
MPPRILLADCDSYFVRCAMLADPEGAGASELVIVGGRADSRGVVTSASYAARKFGVHAGMPMATAVRLCPNAVFAPVPGEMVNRKHHEVRAVLDDFSPVVEAASVDEFYLDLTGTEMLYRGESLEQTALRIQREVMDRTGISISIGGATGRTLAKMAASVNKPFGVHVVPPGGEAAFMQRFELSDIPGVGPALAEALRRRGATAVRDLAGIDLPTLVSWLGDSRAEWLYHLARGEDVGRVSPRGPQKSVSHERTFAKDVRDPEELETRLMMLAVDTGASLRAEGLRARTVTVRIRYGDFTDKSASRTAPDPIQSDRAIFAIARDLLRTLLERRSGGVRLLGVGVSKLVGDQEDELVLFDDPPGGPETERDRILAEASDRLAGRFGKGALVPARIANRGVRDGTRGRGGSET